MSNLYLAHFGLSKSPFQITPDLEFFFSEGQHGEVLSALLHVAHHEEGLTTVVAEVGCGKTLLARVMISRLGADVNTVYLANPSFGRNEILGAIARDLGLSQPSSTTDGGMADLQQELLRRHAAGKRVLLVIDEAHIMPPESLEEVRLLSNLETGQHKLINIMLFGQPELEELLALPRMRQVRDRVVYRFSLQPLTRDKVPAYVKHRLCTAGWQRGVLFTYKAMAKMIVASGGRVRRINLLADKSLLAAYAQGADKVESAHVRAAVAELHADFVAATSHRPLLRWLLGGGVLLVALVGVAYWMQPMPVVNNPVAPIATQPTPMSERQEQKMPEALAPSTMPSVKVPESMQPQPHIGMQ
jgi:MSHA biogenesis protein MshM